MNAGQTPTPTSQTTGNGGSSNGSNGNNSGNGNGTPSPSTTPQGGGFPLLPVMFGIIALLAIGGVSILGFLFLRTRMAPNARLTTNLPPSGARPWSRVRQGNMQDVSSVSNLHGQQTLADASAALGEIPPWVSNVLAATPQSHSYSHMQTGMQQVDSRSVPPSPSFPAVPPSRSWPAPTMPGGGDGFAEGQPVSGFPQPGALTAPSPGQFPVAPNAGFFPSNQGSGDIAHALDVAANAVSGNNHSNNGSNGKHKPAPVRLRSMNSSGNVATASNAGPQYDRGMPTIAEAAQKNSDILPVMPLVPDTQPTQQKVILAPTKDSEELPALDDPFLRDTLKRYMQNNEQP